MPICSKCKAEKPLSAFIKNKSHGSGHNPACKDCDLPARYRQAFAARGGPLTEPKRCARCKVLKPYAAFGIAKQNKDGLQTYCTACIPTVSKHHYHRTSLRPQRVPIHVRFWAQVDCTGREDACWPWQGGVDDDGYGLTKLKNGKPIRAHRLAWEMTHGPLEKGMHVLHWCNNRRCCNVMQHLYAGTQSQNMQQCAIEGRMPGSVRVITPGQARYVRAMQGKIAAWKLAEELGVTRPAISAIWNHRTHKDAV